MHSLKELLYSDLARQYTLEGKTDTPTFFGVIRRLLHHRFCPVFFCRASRQAMLRGIPLLPKIFTYANIILFGIEVSSRCEIGPGLFFPHTSGTVIGARSIGSNATVFQGVTIGAKELDMGFNEESRPLIGNNVVLGAGCKVLGGIEIGDNVVVGANSVVIAAVEPNVTVAGIPARVLNSSARKQD